MGGWPQRGILTAMGEVRLDKVSKLFKDTVAVDGISLTFEEGRFFSLLGPSGCGKTTTLRMIGGFEDPTGGRVFIGGEDVTDVPAHKRNVNTAFQSYALFPHLNVFENVAFGLKRKQTPRAQIGPRVDDMLALVALDGYENRRIQQLSGGQQQRVALARALVNKPQVLLLDEPLGALDLKLRKQMQLELKRIQSEVGITFIYVTHDQEEAMTMSDKVAVMNGGRVEQVGAPQQVYERPATEFVASFLGAANLLDGELESVDGPMAKITLAVGGTVSLPAGNLPSTEAPLRVGVRPEKFHIRAAGDLAHDALTENSIEAVVSISTYTGVSTSYECTTSDGTTIVVYVQNLEAAGGLLSAGARVRLTWHPDHTFVVVRGPRDKGEEE